MHDLLIHRSAQDTGIIVISLERRLRAEIADLLLRYAFQVHGADPGSDYCFYGIQHLPQDASALAHLFDLVTRFTDDCQLLLLQGSALRAAPSRSVRAIQRSL